MFKLLIIDDESRTREGLKKCLPWKSLGVTALKEADDGTSALAIAESFKPDIILSDIRMPNMEGIEFVQQLRDKQLSECKVIFISGYSDKEYLKSAIQLKAVSYIEKPVNIKELEKAVRDAINQCLEEKKSSENARKVEESKPLLLQELVLSLTQQGCTKKDLQKKLALSGCDLPVEGHYLAAIFQPYAASSAPVEDHLELRSQLADYIQGTLAEHKVKNIIGFKDESQILTFLYLSRDTPLHMVAAIIRRLTLNLPAWATGMAAKNISLAVGVGLPVRGMDNLYRSFQRATMALQESYFWGGGRAFFYQKRPKAEAGLISRREEEFRNYLTAAEREKLLALIDELSTNPGIEQTLTIHDLKTLFYNFLMILHEQAAQREIVLWAPDTTPGDLWTGVFSLDTLEKISAYTKKYIHEFCRGVNEIEENGRTVYEIKHFIHQHYSQHQLDLSQIAAHLHFTPAYLCQIFKKKTGQTINEYLTEYRIEMAKDLLKERKAKLYEIARLIGYKDVKYFNKVFKKITGMTPSEYRERY